MFATGNRHEIRIRRFSALTQLTREEQNELKACEYTILTGTRKEKFTLVQSKLCNFEEIGKIYKFCYHSPVFQSFCDKNEFNHQQLWINTLKILGYAGETIIPIDKGEPINVFKQYLGAYFFSEYLLFKEKEKPMDPDRAEFYLDLACEYGLFSALAERCAINQANIKNPAVSDQVLTDSLAEIITDTDRMGNLYWTVGHLHGALVLLDIGNYLANQDSEASHFQGQTFQASAADFFLFAKELSAYKGLEQDEAITREICGEDGLAVVFRFDNWDDPQNFFLKHVNNDDSNHGKLITNAKKSAQALLGIDRHEVHGLAGNVLKRV